MSTNLSIKSPLPAILAWGRKLRPYAGFMTFLLLAAIYGFMILRVSEYSNPAVDEAEVAAEAKSSPTPRIDADAVRKLESLKDNSVNVQTLFVENRTDPFQE